MQAYFGSLPSGEAATLYTLKLGNLTAKVTDLGATLVSLLVPDREGMLADVVLGYDSCEGYLQGNAFLGATVGRNANRIAGASFLMNGQRIDLPANENGNSLHSGPDHFHTRLWQVERREDTAITFRLDSPHGDQGYPGNAVIRVTYALQHPATLAIRYEGRSDRDTVFNMTNHSYFNLAGHDQQASAMAQTLMLPARFFTPADASSIPTGEACSVAGTPMDFRSPKPLGQDMEADYGPLHLQGGIDHNFEVFCSPCAVLTDPASGRCMAIHTDCPGIQVYTANFTREQGKGGAAYTPRCAVALETQFFPDSVNNPQWRQPFVKAGALYKSETQYSFTVI